MKWQTLFLIATHGVIAGCAGSTGGSVPQLANGQTASNSSTGAASGYNLSAEEKDLTCKQLTGRMQVRILQVRDYGGRQKTSSLSREIHSATNSTMGGSAHGSDPDGQHQRDRAQLAAYNKLLAKKKCATFNLAEELKPKDVTHTPRPQKSSKKN